MLPKSLITRVIPLGAQEEHDGRQIEVIGDDHGDHQDEAKEKPQGHPAEDLWGQSVRLIEDNAHSLQRMGRDIDFLIESQCLYFAYMGFVPDV